MFTGDKLTKAILRNDIDAIRALVEKHGAEILQKKLSGSHARGHAHPGDRWLKRVFNNPLPLSLALFKSDEATIAALVSMGAHPRQPVDSNFPNHLFVAAALGRVRVLQAWIDRYPTLRDARNHDNDHLLHIAAQHGQAGAVAFLIDSGRFSLTARSQQSGCTPLMYAERVRDAACVTLLLDAETALKADPTARPMPAAWAGGDAKGHWHVIDGQRIARLHNDAKGRLTEIFNFQTKDVWRIARDASTGHMTEAATGFGDVTDDGAIADAAARLGVDPFDKRGRNRRIS